MIFVTGPLYSGKQKTICRMLGWSEEEFQKNAVRDVQNLVKTDISLEQLTDELSQKQVVLATEIGGGVVPIDTEQRMQREKAGRLACLLAERADTVVRVCCGIPQILKGKLP